MAGEGRLPLSSFGCRSLMARLGLIAAVFFGLISLVAPILLQDSVAQVPASAISMFLALACYELIYQRG